MPVYWLSDGDITFPHPRQATEDGVLAVGGDLSPERLLFAYSWGIFPWYSEGQPILWWSPDPRFVLFPEKLKVSRSMRPYFNQKKFSVTYDQAFTEVMRQCQGARRYQQFGTWITEDMVEAYTHLHELGHAHSVEVWKEEELVGGLYGIAQGRVFFGESMFSKQSNASKFGFIKLVRFLQERGFTLIDCQQETEHLRSLGAEAIPRERFLAMLEDNRKIPLESGQWTV